MKQKICLVILVHLLSSLLQVSWADDVAFPPSNLSDLVGSSTCSLSSESRIGMFRLPFNDVEGHALEFRKIGSLEAVFLLNGVYRPDDCGEIISVLNLRPHKNSETIEFDCFLKGDKERLRRIIGLADNRKGQLRYPIARLAWDLKLTQNIFEPIKNKTIICDTRGYAE